jgi:hypothetical protein
MSELIVPAALPSMPTEIIKAIVAVTMEVKKLAKEGNNTFARYKYTSVDQFYEALGPLMASHGLIDVVDETSTVVEVRESANDRGEIKRSAWLLATYDIWLHHVSGASFGPLHRAIQVSATGAQSFASAQSFVEKYFLRNLFKVPTGDIDEVDDSDKGDLPAGNVVNLRADKKITETQVGMILTALKALTDKTIESAMLKAVGVEKITDIPASKVEGVMSRLSAKFSEQSKAGMAEIDKKMAEQGVDP